MLRRLDTMTLGVDERRFGSLRFPTRRSVCLLGVLSNRTRSWQWNCQQTSVSCWDESLAFIWRSGEAPAWSAYKRQGSTIHRTHFLLNNNVLLKESLKWRRSRLRT